MADITSYGPIRRLRSEPTIHTLRFRRGTLAAQGRGLAFLFRPAVTGVAEVPVDDRDATFLFHARTSDFQRVTIQGVLTYRVEDPARLADRVDFTVDLRDGTWRKEPLEQVAGLLTQLAQQATLDLVATLDLREAVRISIDRVRSVITTQLVGDDRLADLGLGIVGSACTTRSQPPRWRPRCRRPCRRPCSSRPTRPASPAVHWPWTRNEPSPRTNSRTDSHSHVERRS